MVTWHEKILVLFHPHISTFEKDANPIQHDILGARLYVANNMDPDQTFPKGAVLSGFIVFSCMIKFSLKCT